MENQSLTDAEYIEAIVVYLQGELENSAPIGARLKFSYTQGGAVLIDGTTSPVVVSSTDGEADCVVALSLATHLAMLQFQLDQGVAFRRGDLKVSGDMATALRLAPLMSQRFHPPGEVA